MQVAYKYNFQIVPFGYVHTTLNVPYLIPNCEVNKCLAFLVLAWGTSWEPDGDVTFWFFLRDLRIEFNYGLWFFIFLRSLYNGFMVVLLSK